MVVTGVGGPQTAGRQRPLEVGDLLGLRQQEHPAHVTDAVSTLMKQKQVLHLRCRLPAVSIR